MTFYQSSDELPSVSDYDIRKGRTYMYPSNKDGKKKVEPGAFLVKVGSSSQDIRATGRVTVR